MRSALILLVFLFSLSGTSAQSLISGKVISAETGEPVPFATVQTSDDNRTLTNIRGNFELETESGSEKFIISYPEFSPKEVAIDPSSSFYLIRLSAKAALSAEGISEEEKKINDIISLAIENRKNNDPQLALDTYKFNSYTKLVIDKQRDLLGDVIDPYSLEKEENQTASRSFLSEKVSEHIYKKPGYEKEIVTGFATAGFKSPAYEVLLFNIDPPSLYGNDYPFYGISYSGPLGKNALNNYTYKILDTVAIENRPGYLVYFKPKKETKTPGWEGIFYLDTESLAIQKANIQLYQAIHIEVDYNFSYNEFENIWFPKNKQVVLKPGTGGKDVAIFGGSISLGTVQRRSSILNMVLRSSELKKNLALTSTTTHFDIGLNEPVELENYTASVKVLKEAIDRPDNFWEAHRQQPFTREDELTPPRVETALEEENVLRKIEVLDAVSSGFYPVKFWNFELGNFVQYNNYEGLRLGAGGETNEKFSENFRLNSYVAYGIKDRAFKYGIGGGVLLNGRTGTWLNLSYRQDIREVASHSFIKGEQDFSILEPRLVNISYYYSYNTLETSIEHRITPLMDAEISFSRSDISQLREYAFLNDGQLYRNYTITEAQLGFLWRPFSKFLSTPRSHFLYDKRYPIITGQLTKSLDGTFGGDFNFTKLSLQARYQHFRQNLSVTQITLEGNYGVGELPLTHAFHSFPNNPNKPGIFDRFSVAGERSFETMYFNEFFSDRQASVHIKHQFAPFKITSSIKPELVLISRHVIGNFSNTAAHQNITFNTLEHVYSEGGLELNKILLGFGLSTAYRYGAYQLPTFKENFSLKFTFQLSI